MKAGTVFLLLDVHGVSHAEDANAPRATGPLCEDWSRAGVRPRITGRYALMTAPMFLDPAAEARGRNVCPGCRAALDAA